MRTRRTRPAGWRVCCSVRSISKLRVALLLVSTGAAGFGAAAAAAFGPGGVLLAAGVNLTLMLVYYLFA